MIDLEIVKEPICHALGKNEVQPESSIYQAYKSLNRIPKDYKGAYASEVKSLLYVAEKDYNREAQKTLDIRNKKFLNINVTIVITIK